MKPRSFEEQVRCLGEPPPAAAPPIVQEQPAAPVQEQKRKLPMDTLRFVLMILGFVCVALAAAGVTVPRAHIGWLGVALWMLSVLILRG